MQLPLLPLKVSWVGPNPFGTGVDLRHVVMTADGMDFAVKSVADHPMLPASEFLGYRLAQSCQLAVPHAQTLEMPGGEMVFGSRIEAGARSPATPQERMTAVAACAESMSATLALDLFLANDDRHLGNFLIRENRNGQPCAMVIDFSRALFVNGFPDDQFPQSETNTTTTIAILRSLAMWRMPAAIATIQQLQAIGPEHIDHWLREMPPAWLPIAKRTRLLAWWGSPDYHARLTAVLALL